MKSMTRRGFLASSAVLAGLAGLSGCDNGTDASSDAAAGVPSADSYPIDPEEWGSGDVAYTVDEVDTEDSRYVSWTRAVNKDGATVGAADSSLLIQVGGYAFKDSNGNGKLDFWEDWRQNPAERAAALAEEMETEELINTLAVDRNVYVSGNIGQRVDEIQQELVEKCQRQMQGGYFFKGIAPDGLQWARWSNRLQASCEGTHHSIPVHFYADPFNVPGEEWPGSVGLGASFDPQVAWDYGYWHAREYRALGIHTVLGPQIDTTTDPRWSRAGGTFGEDPALSRDMAQAEVSALQSTWSDDGSDEGWGTDSVAAMIKHWPGDGAGMFGWESHNRAGRYSVFPQGNFALQTIPFVDGALNLDSSTKRAAAVMPSYSIAYSDTEEWGELVGSAFSEYKMSLLRNTCEFDGPAVSDWQVIDDGGFHTWGVDDLTPAERVAKGWKVGTDAWGGQDDLAPLNEGYELLKKDLGEEEALALIKSANSRVLKNSFILGLFDNPYLDPEESAKIIGSEEALAASLDAAHKSIVMLKNSGGIISENVWADKKPTVYLPKTYTASYISPGRDGAPDTFVPATLTLPVDEELLGEYFTVVTDTVADTLTGDPDDEGNPTIAEQDIIWASPEEIAACDFACVFAQSPTNEHNADGVDEDGNYIPVSLMYGPYVADGESGCPEESPAGDVDASGAKENLSPYGNASMISNTGDLDNILRCAEAMGDPNKVVVCINSDTAGMVFTEFEPQVGVILYGFGASYQAFLDIVTGKVEPSALLPFQMPADMKTVETQATDTPRDMECHVDSDGNEYDFGFGLNWSGVISDERTEKYCVEPVTTPETIEI